MRLCYINKSNQYWSSYVALFMRLRLRLRYQCTANVIQWWRKYINGATALLQKMSSKHTFAVCVTEYMSQWLVCKCNPKGSPGGANFSLAIIIDWNCTQPKGVPWCSLVCGEPYLVMWEAILGLVVRESHPWCYSHITCKVHVSS